MIKYIEGDVIDMFLTKEYNCLFHQANCQSQFPGLTRHGAGVAKGIAVNFPEMVKAEDEAIQRGDECFKFGSLFSHEQFPGCHIVNLFSQFQFGSTNQTFIPINRHNFSSPMYDNLRGRLLALESSLKAFKTKFDSSNSVIMPLVASGIAKDRAYSSFDDLKYFEMIIAPIIEEQLSDYDVTVVIWV
jgi:hypothetical protein